MNHTLEVSVSLVHSASHATVLLPSMYPPSLSEHFESLGNFQYLTLKEKVPSSTSIGQIRHLLDRQHHIPASVQSYFWLQTFFKAGWGKHTYEEDVTLSEIWQSQADPENGGVDLNISTTAARLGEIVSLRERSGIFGSGGDGLVDCLLEWRHFDGALRYLKNHPEFGQNPDRMAAYDKRLQEYQILEFSHAQKVRQMFAEWALLIHNTVVQVPSKEETREQRTQDIEYRFREWLIEKQTVIAKALAHTRTTTASHDETKTQANEEVASQTGTTRSEQSDPKNGSVISQSPSQKPIPMESRLSFDFPPRNQAFTSISLRTTSGDLDPDCNTFTVQSGILLWGQIHTVFAGSINHNFDTRASSAPETLQGGTLMQQVMRYRAAARKGIWKVRKAFCLPNPGNEGEPTRHLGWVFFHEDVDAAETLDRCNRISPGSAAISHKNDHVDQDIHYINRYDWSFHCKPGATNPSFAPAYERFIQESTGVKLSNDQGLLASETKDPLVSTRTGGFMLAVDASYFGNDFMYKFMNDCSPTEADEERIFCKQGVGDEERQEYGAYVTKKNAEYDLAWLIFSGKKHVDFPEEDELVAIVYDAAYTALESHKFAVEGD